MAKYKAAIVGLGDIAVRPVAPAFDPVLGEEEPYSHAAAYALVPEVEVVAVCDIVPAALDNFARLWSHRWPGVRLYDDWRTMLEKEQLDMVSVVTPDHLHADLAVAACEAGVKMLLLEKPLATSHEDAQRIIDAVERHGVVATVNHTRRYGPHYRWALHQLRQGTIGQLSAIIGYYGGPRAMLFRNTSHMLDVICMMAQDDPAWVAAELDKDNQDYGTVYKGDGGRDPAQDPGAEIWIGFAGGLRAYLSALKTNPEEMNIRLIGSRGSIILRQREAELELASGWRVTKQSAPLERFSRSGEMAAIYELIQIYETGQGTTQCPPREAYKTVRLLLGALASNAAGGARVPV